MSDLDKLKMLIEKYAVFSAVEWPDGRHASVYDECMKLISNIESGGWVSVDERLPGTIGSCLIFTSTRLIAWSFFNSNEDFIDCQEQCCFDEVTHWMPLPSAPTK